jgi:hypothetical protein
VAVELPTTKTG